MSTANQALLPSEGLCYDPEDRRYWSEELLDQELTRAFDVCTNCRLCFKFCDVFPTLFSLLDEEHGGDVRRVTPKEADSTLGHCFQCKLCEVQCPYTPRDGHAYQLDVPRLVHRHRAVSSSGRKKALRERLLGDPDLLGRLARKSRGLCNTLNRMRPVRYLLEKVLGIHREKLLPGFASRTFSDQAAARFAAVRPLAPKQAQAGEVVVFAGCYVEHNEPAIGMDTLSVLERNGVDWRVAPGQVCCGMPAWEQGDLAAVRAKASANLAALMPVVERGVKVLAINPTCSMMLRVEYPQLLATPDRERAAQLSGAVMDPSEFLWSIRAEARFNTRFESTPDGPVAYHVPCHLRAQSVGFKGRDLIRKVQGASPQLVAECSGHDGTYAMKVEGFEPSARLGSKAFGEMRAAQAEVWVSECPLAALQFEQHAGRKPMHPMSFLAKAYRPPQAGGFPAGISPGASPHSPHSSREHTS